MISAGLDGTVTLWDVRTLGTTQNASPIASYNGGRSVNSAYFSPSGRYVVSTTMANKLDLFEDVHLAIASDGDDSPSAKQKPNGTSTALLKPYKSIAHDNMTGRWLTTFQAIFHPQLDLFAVGSMRQPRCVELFDPSPARLLRTVTGDALTAVASRLAFHPRTDALIVVGGNSSGRATIVRR
jgi:WD repeat-containing protein 76